MIVKLPISRPSFLLAGLCAPATLAAWAGWAGPPYEILFSQQTLPFNEERF